MQPLNLTGERFGKLVAIAPCGSRRGQRLWRVRCDCGREAEVPTGALRSGGTTSCGCRRAETHHAKAQPVFDRLWKKISPEPNTGCWLWTGYVNARGYGVTSKPAAHGKSFLAHRVMYECLRGQIPAGLELLHSCDVNSCANPWHARPGTTQENLHEKTVRGRCPVKVTTQDVAAIRSRRAAGETVYAVAARYGISIAQVSRITNFKRRAIC